MMREFRNNWVLLRVTLFIAFALIVVFSKLELNDIQHTISNIFTYFLMFFLICIAAVTVGATQSIKIDDKEITVNYVSLSELGNKERITIKSIKRIFCIKTKWIKDVEDLIICTDKKWFTMRNVSEFSNHEEIIDEIENVSGKKAEFITYAELERYREKNDLN